jgi:hypothetical protein
MDDIRLFQCRYIGASGQAPYQRHWELSRMLGSKEDFHPYLLPDLKLFRGNGDPMLLISIDKRSQIRSFLKRARG